MLLSLLASYVEDHNLDPKHIDGLTSLLSTLSSKDPTEVDAGATLVPAADSTSIPILSRQTSSASRYKTLQRLAAGGMGEIHRVQDSMLGRAVVRKTIQQRFLGNETILARFVEEAQCASQLQHPGIVPIYDIGVLEDGRPYFTMAEIRGRTFSELIHSVHNLGLRGQATTPDGWSFHRLLSAFQQVCDTVSYAHSRGVLHRDIKPDNIMVGEHGEVIVIDWGLAKVLAAEGEPASPLTTIRSGGALETVFGSVSGTPAYMSPEQAKGAVDQIDQRSDVYALGGLLFFLLSGTHPSTEISDNRAVPLADQILDPTLIELVELCSMALAQRPEDRIQKVTQLSAGIVNWLNGAKNVRPPKRWWTRHWSSRKTSPS